MFTVVTHSQQFHIDEVVAIALLDLYFLNGEYSVIRANRKDKIIEESKISKTCFVIDIGFEYDTDFLNFDHHQNSDSLCWNDGLPYSSCGLIWQWLKNTNKLESNLDMDVILRIEEKLIKKVDMHDNGISIWKEGEFISLYNRKTDDQAIQDIQFLKAVGSAKDYIENLVINIKNDIKADKTILKYIKNSEYIDDIVIFGSNVPNGALRVLELTNKKLVIIPRTKNSWTIQSVPEIQNDPFSMKCPSPLSWRGLTDEFLSTKSGIPNMIFCHKNGYVTMLSGTIDDALKVANIIIENNKHI
jgi:uncharacterized UPF0160 family protein